MKFPKKLFVKIGGEGDEQYFDPHRSINTMVDAGESASVAVYSLAEVIKVEGSVTVVSAKPTKK